MGKLTVLDGGLFSTIQDEGRFGFRKFGVPISGAMDSESYKLANTLVGNPSDFPVVEFSLKGGKYKFDSEAFIAITGALMNPKLNGEQIQMNTSIKVEAGSILELGFAQKGVRAYLGISGVWDIKKVMESYSTCISGQFGGYKGRILQAGDEIKWQDQSHDYEVKSLSKGKTPYFSSKITVNFIAGPEWDWLTEKEQRNFLATSFKVDSRSNRMGIRLEMNEQIGIQKREMKSSGVIPGIIQLPPNGKPIVLMHDGQTVGGYPRIGKIVDSDLHRVAQVPPNGIIRFNKGKI